MLLTLRPRRAGVLAVLVLACAWGRSAASERLDGNGERWVATWGAAPVAARAAPSFSNQTLRLVVHTSVGGNRVRIRLSNAFGAAPLRIGAARIAVRATGADVAPGSDRALAFQGRGETLIPAGATLLSDPVELNVPALADLAVSLYLPVPTAAATLHATALQTNYVSPPGDFSAAASLPVQRTIAAWPFLTDVEVDGGAPAIVVMGDAIAAGSGSSADSNKRWPDWLARRLQALRDPRLAATGRAAVVNRAGRDARLVEAAAAGGALPGRVERAVLATSGVRYLILTLGMEDLVDRPAAMPASGAGPAEHLVAACRRLIARAHAHGIAVFGATLTPFAGAGAYSPAKEALRQAVNAWIRASDEFDGVVDFDLALRDPVQPARLLPAYDSGDHLHPGDLGHQAMGDAVPLTLFGPSDGR